jgi:hypothetical protein
MGIVRILIDSCSFIPVLDMHTSTCDTNHSGFPIKWLNIAADLGILLAVAVN